MIIILSYTNMYKINTLLKSDQKLFHTQDLFLLWNINNKNTLYTTISRYVEKGILIPIHKGFYSTVPIDQIDPVRFGIGYLHSFAYLSCESILVAHGLLFQQSDYITLISSRSTKFQIAERNYLVRKSADRYLLNPTGILSSNGIYKANLDRAVADMLYFNPHFHFDAREKVSWKKIRFIQKEVYGL